jgi:hypothetical protein
LGTAFHSWNIAILRSNFVSGVRYTCSFRPRQSSSGFRNGRVWCQQQVTLTAGEAGRFYPSLRSEARELMSKNETGAQTSLLPCVINLQATTLALQ